MPVNVTRRTVLQKVRGCAHKALPQLVNTGGFRFSFTPLPGSFFTFLHSTMRYRSLRGIWPWRVVPPASTRFPVSHWYSGSSSLSSISPTGFFTLSDQISQNCSAIDSSTLCSPQPRGARTPRFGLFSFWRLYFGNRGFLSSPPGYLPDVSVSPGFPSPIRYGLAYGYLSLLKWVSPFGYLGSMDICSSRKTFRSLSRPSSALSAKASTLLSSISISCS